MIGDPPLLVGAVHVIVDLAFSPFDALAPVGALGRVALTTTSGSEKRFTYTSPSAAATAAAVVTDDGAGVPMMLKADAPF